MTIAFACGCAITANKPPRQAMRGRPHDLIKPGGLGLHLIRNAFDKVDYILRQRGTELVLTKNLERDRVNAPCDWSGPRMILFMQTNTRATR